MLKKYINPFTLGLLFLLLFFIQFVLQLKWPALYNLQQEEMYKRWSGLVLGLFILFQWLLTLFRLVPKLRQYSMKMAGVHKWIGAISPLLFYIHSSIFGYGYLLLLSIIFMTNMLLGTVNLDIIKNEKDWIFKSWMIAHVSFSLIITFITFLHVGVVFYYK